LVFATCDGAGLGLLRREQFEIVLIDSASQQTEPESLVPLSKGCQRAIFVGDHAQSRATVRRHGDIADFAISLFEKHYTRHCTPGVAKVMLDTQYSIHPTICDFSSREFYQNKLKSANSSLTLPPSKFPWPENNRMVFLQSHASEDLGHSSKTNEGQTRLCQRVYDQLQIPSTNQSGPSKRNAKQVEIVIVTPYTRQKHILERAVPGPEICTVDEYQDRLADIVIFVSVRCNVHLDIGSLRDIRLLNAVLTGARAGIILIGDRLTLTGPSESCYDVESKAIWARLLESCVQVQLQ